MQRTNVLELYYDDRRQAAAYNATRKRTHLDIVELFGGEGGTTRMGIKLSLRGGINFDIITGFDLMNKADVTFLWEYLHKKKPRCVVMAPPHARRSVSGHSAIGYILLQEQHC